MNTSLTTKICTAVALIAVGCAQAVAQPVMGSSRASISLVSEHTALIPGESSWVALRFQIDQDWHVYWQNAGDSGQPPEQHWEVSEGVSIGEPLWPAPIRHVSPGEILDYIHEHELVLLYPVAVADSVTAGETVTLEVESDFLICKDVCLFGDGKASITLPVADKAAPSSNQSVFERARRFVTRPPELAGEIGLRTEWDGGELILSAKGATRLTFFPHSGEHLARPMDLLQSGTAEGDTLRIPFESDENATGIAGVVTMMMGDQVFHQEVRSSVHSSAGRIP